MEIRTNFCCLDERPSDYAALCPLGSVQMKEIAVHHIDNFLLLLKWSHQKGFQTADKHILEPLRLFFGRPDKEPHANIEENLRIQRKLKQWRITSNIYKSIMHMQCFEADHHPIVRTINQFLMDMQAQPALRKTTFAYEFFKAFEYYLKNLQEIMSAEVISGMADVFDQNSQLDIVVSHSLTSNQRESLNSEAAELYNKIELAYARGDENKLSYLLAQFTGRFCNYPEVRYRDEVDALIMKVAENNAGFHQDMRSRLAVRIFQVIARSAEKMDLKTAVRGITTYVITFQDDLSLPYREELDHIEEKMYRFIERHNLWHRVRLQRGGESTATTGVS
jgi:hypothetical protein